MSVNNLLKVITRQRSWWDSNPRPLSHWSEILPLRTPVTPPRLQLNVHRHCISDDGDKRRGKPCRKSRRNKRVDRRSRLHQADKWEIPGGNYSQSMTDKLIISRRHTCGHAATSRVIIRTRTKSDPVILQCSSDNPSVFIGFCYIVAGQL